MSTALAIAHVLGLACLVTLMVSSFIVAGAWLVARAERRRREHQ